MEESATIFLIGGGDEEQATFEWGELDDEQCRVRCTYRGKSIEADASDFFDALCGVREQLASEGLIPFCYGASLNVFPSGMSRSMGGALKAYKLTMGHPATIADLVHIFSDGPDVIPASVERQSEFFQDWIASLPG